MRDDFASLCNHKINEASTSTSVSQSQLFIEGSQWPIDALVKEQTVIRYCLVTHTRLVCARIHTPC